jgi:hypothetical protein
MIRMSSQLSQMSVPNQCRGGRKATAQQLAALATLTAVSCARDRVFPYLRNALLHRALFQSDSMATEHDATKYGEPI